MSDARKEIVERIVEREVIRWVLLLLSIPRQTCSFCPCFLILSQSLSFLLFIPSSFLSLFISLIIYLFIYLFISSLSPLLREIRVGISEEEMKEINQKANEEKQILMKQAQVMISSFLSTIRTKYFSFHFLRTFFPTDLVLFLSQFLNLFLLNSPSISIIFVLCCLYTNFFYPSSIFLFF